MKKRYSTEFRAQAVELVRLGNPVAVVAEDLCIGTPDVELCQLRRENANLKLERHRRRSGYRRLAQEYCTSLASSL